MEDKIEQIGNSVIQHGKLNDRVYIMSLKKGDVSSVIDETNRLCRNKRYSKVFAKVPESLSEEFINQNYKVEAEIDNFYKGKEKCLFLSKFLIDERAIKKRVVNLDEVLKIAKSKSITSKTPVLGQHYVIKLLSEKNAVEMSELYKDVFDSYPFPIFDPEYLVETIKDNIEYAGIFYKNRLVSIASAEKYSDYLNAEMTDFATHPNFLGNSFSLVLLKFLETKLIKQNYKTLYTIARARSKAMNITFRKCGYNFSGTLVNNTNISGDIESMNVWYKKL